MDEVGFIAITTVILALATCVRPVTASCPPSWRHNGVGGETTAFRRRGEFSCDYYPYAENDPAARTYPYRISGRIYCADPRPPIVIDIRTVACR